MLIFPRQHQFYRFARNAREFRGGVSFHPRAEFTTETAAHVFSDDAHLVRGQFKVLCEIVTRAENRLCGCPHRQVLFVSPFGDVSVRLQADMRLDRRVVGSFHHNGGFLEACLKFAFLAEIRVALIAVPIVTNLRRAFLHRIRFRDNEGQFLHVYVDETECVLRDIVSFRGDSGDFLSLIAKFLPDFNQRNHRLNTGQCLGGTHIDAVDGGVRNFGTQDAPIKHPRPIDVKGILRLACNFILTGQTGYPLADEARFTRFSP